MGTENGSIQSEKERRIKERDAQTPSPEIRAKAIWDILNSRTPRPRFWDLICFSIECLSVGLIEYPFLLPLVKRLNVLIYGIHYDNDSVIDSALTTNGEWKNEGD